MARQYRVLPGHAFDLGNGTTAPGGAVIELEDDVAALHAHRVTPLVQTSAPEAATTGDPATGED